MDRYTWFKTLDELVSAASEAGVRFTGFITTEYTDGSFGVDMRASHDEMEVYYGIAEGILTRFKPGDFPDDERSPEHPMDPTAN
ncbi:hypothetical protein [Deinococcus humi]|uniref:Uncharacterized protein n=1 Tax=Deinococcus humi TaxID=662880 RepID=A0A7W8JQD1_9DEIO|nr:hypothetical protein [Deinococcus humi]MBB5361287.1 hypothetical protein [Deinococcus humi]GGO19320.1 hypothetical protein GCM10008949_03530 [Deinococcus humi]